MDESEKVEMSLALDRLSLDALDPSDAGHLDALATALRNLGHEKLDDEPVIACDLARAAHVLDVVRVAIEIATAHPGPQERRTTKSGAIAKPAKPSTPGLAKVKHVYGDNGVCLVDHDGNGPCAKLRERKPRAGASVAAAACEDVRTLPIPGTVSP